VLPAGSFEHPTAGHVEWGAVTECVARRACLLRARRLSVTQPEGRASAAPRRLKLLTTPLDVPALVDAVVPTPVNHSATRRMDEFEVGMVSLRAILRTCVEGQIAMMEALTDLVDREMRGALRGRIASHQQLHERLLSASVTQPAKDAT
jgi:hypothetical protein